MTFGVGVHLIAYDTIPLPPSLAIYLFSQCTPGYDCRIRVFYVCCGSVFLWSTVHALDTWYVPLDLSTFIIILTDVLPYFTLCSYTGSAHWTVTGIMWLMVQIWFGNTFLSFTQANSFHPVFGPILMTMFAVLANTLLLTSMLTFFGHAT